jgi:uncharacterized protein (TIRG00374 family)
LRRKTKKRAFLALRIGVAIGLMAYVSHSINFSQLWDQIKNVRFGFVFLGISLFLTIPLLSTLRWKLVLGVHGVKPSFYKLCKLFFIGLFFNNTMPGLTGGDVIKAYYVTRETDDRKTEAVTSVFVDRVVGLTGLLVVGIIALLFNLQNPDLRQIATLIIIMFLSMIFFVLIFFNKEMFVGMPFIFRLLDSVPFKETMIRIYDACHKYKHDVHIIIYGLGLSLIIHGINIIMVMMLGFSLSLDSVGLTHYFLFIPVIAVISALPISISGLGVGEQLYVYCFGLVGAEAESALAIAIMVRLIVLVCSLPGLFYYVTIGERGMSKARMEEEVRPLVGQV